MRVTERIVRVQLRKPVGPGIEDTTITDFYRLDPSSDENAKAYGDNMVRKDPLSAAGWIPNVSLVTEDQFAREVYCG